MATSVTKTVGVVFTGDIADLSESMDTLVDEAKETSKEMAEAFSGLAGQIEAEWGDLGDSLGEDLSSAGEGAGEKGVDALAVVPHPGQGRFPVNRKSVVGYGLCRDVAVSIARVTGQTSAVSYIPVKGCTCSGRCNIDRIAACTAANSLRC